MSSIVNSSIIRIVFKELIFVCRDGSIRKIKFTENIHIFRCPICKTNMYIYDSKDIACLEGHCFNIARKGYVNFLLKSIDTDYDREMFYSRNIVYKMAFYSNVRRYKWLDSRKAWLRPRWCKYIGCWLR